MLAAHLRSVPADRLDAPAVVCGDRAVTYGDLATRVEVLMQRWRPLAGFRVGMALGDPADHVAVAAALDGLRCRSFLAAGRSAAAVRALAEQLQWHAVVWSLIDAPEILRPPPSGVECRGEGIATVLTSGSTGRPKAASHTWTTLAGPVRTDSRYAAARWLCAYPLHLYAGVQVMLQALMNWSAVVIPPVLDAATIARTMRTARVTHASGTPTFWRQLLLFGSREDLGGCRLEQITMGGEAVTQPLLDRLSERFPGARLAHIYASTELGRLFAVTDKREGFPAAFLDASPEPGIELRIVEGELTARSRHAMLGYDNGDGNASTARPGEWITTGDLVERQGDRVFFRGRKSELINVGGRKVSPLTVEAVLREARGVSDVRVYGRGSSMVGQLVAADIVLEQGCDEQDVRAELHRLTRDRLAPHEAPRVVRIVGAIPQSGALKVVRSGVE